MRMKFTAATGIAYQNNQNWVNSTYAHLDTFAKEFLITSETL